ncbi:MAG: DEAD/DEAH box helicase [Parvularculaceae bacterium]
MSFEDLGLEPTLLKAIAEAGYSAPTPIQKAAIPEALKRRDVLGIAQTGTGKTASFTLPMIQHLGNGRARARMPRSLVLCPTRELAAQVSENFEKYGKYHKLSMALLIGGVSFGDQDMKLTRGVDVLIATPGRLLDHFERGRLLLTGIEVMVVDEADRMLDMGFIPDIERIFKLTPPTRQTLFFSATMPPEITRLTQQFLTDPVRIEVDRPATAAETVTQRILRLDTKDDRTKRAALRKLLQYEGVRNGIIFCNRKTTVDIVAKSLQTHGFNARPIHGDLAQSDRTETLDKFRSGELQFLVASDVAARGLDIPAVSHVFNFDVPIHSEDYIHRIGRTGRAGLQGCTFMIVTPSDGKAYDAILRTTGAKAIEALDLKIEVEPEAEGGRRGRPERSDRRDRHANGDRPRRGPREDRPAHRSEERPSEPRREQHEPSAEPNNTGHGDTVHGDPGRSDAGRRDAPRRDRAPAFSADNARPPRRDSARREAPRREEKVVGLGEHVPGFLLR